MDYYAILNVNRDASFQDIAVAFRQLALTYHPSKNIANKATTNFKFCQICEAFEVLSTQELRDFYDRYGEQVLKNGIPDNQTNAHKSYSFSGDPIEIFENFFGTVNPFHIALDREGKQIPLIEKIESDIHKDYIRSESIQGEDLVLTVVCSLQELFQGSTKRITYSRIVDTSTSFTETKSEKQRMKMDVFVKPGMKDGTQIRYPGLGNKIDLKHTGDLVVELKAQAHPTMVRQGNNLVYSHKISLLEALTSTPIQFQTIDGETIRFTADEVINTETRKVFQGKGMPIYNDDPLSPLMHNNKRGDLIVKFNIEMPQSLSSATRDKLVEVLSQ